jgi:hypothetical protein
MAERISPDFRATLVRSLLPGVCALGFFVLSLVRPAQVRADNLHLADYDAELRLPNGRVDIATMASRLKELGVTTCYWLIAHAASDWDDLKLFLPEAGKAGIEVWVYLVPPSESAPKYSNLYPEPFRLDYQQWAEEIAKLSLRHTNLTAWVIDDFYENHQLYTPPYVGQMQERSKRINPRLRFLPLMYFNEINRRFVEDYRKVIDGVVVAYPPDRQEIDRASALLNDEATAAPGDLIFPHHTFSQPDDFVMVSQSVEILPAVRRTIRFLEKDDFTGPTDGYHFKQLLINGAVVWEQDVAGGTNDWREINVDVSRVAAASTARTNVTLAFRLFDKKGVSNFGVRWSVSDLQTDGLKPAATLGHPESWDLVKRGKFEAGFGSALSGPKRAFHVPFIVMTAAQPIEFKLRHGEPTTPERISQWLQMCLDEYRENRCDGVVTYCVDKTPASPMFPFEQKLFREFRQKHSH